MRYFGGKEIELLAPAGNYEILEGIVKTNCDAVYFGGQSLNMRMIRKGFNFTNEELPKAIELIHNHGKRAYITVNNLIDCGEINEAKSFLKYLDEIKPDAIIVQDFAVLMLIKELKLNLPIHASVMMNVHNIPMIKSLKEHGVSRVVLSREMSLAEAQHIKDSIDIELEYFTHGDMCIAHGAQCYYSSMLFGMSSNKGKCLKPCRWWFTTNQSDDKKQFPLAVKDMSMYPYLAEMIHSGITSFKIEGRMREKSFICNLINLYGNAMDNFIEDPVGYDRYKDYQSIIDGRKRDLFSAYAFGKPGSRNINDRFEGSGKLYSTGKMFSTPTSETAITMAQTEMIRHKLHVSQKSEVNQQKLSVKVNNVSQAKLAIGLAVDRIYLSGDVFNNDVPFSINDIIELRNLINQGESHSVELFAGTPRMMNELQLALYDSWLLKIKPYIDGILVGNLGAIEAFKDIGLPLAGDYSLNILNPLSAEFYFNEGLSSLTPSLEINTENFKNLMTKSTGFEAVIHGRIPVMYFEHDFYEVFNKGSDELLTIYNEAGAYDIYRDQHNRTHMISTHTFTLLPFVKELKNLGVEMVRFEAQNKDLDDLQSSLMMIKSAIANNEDITGILIKEAANYTYGAFQF